MKIMVVDDDEPIRKSLQFLLACEGYSVEIASDGCDALKKLINPKIILLDIMMAPMDGLAFIHMLAQQGKQANYTIFVMTAMAGIINELSEMCQQKIIHGFIIKPFIFSEELLDEFHAICTA